MNGVEELLKRISTRGDVAAASLGYVAGYILAAVLAVHQLPAGVGGVLGAVALVGSRMLSRASLPVISTRGGCVAVWTVGLMPSRNSSKETKRHIGKH
jgi:hypothetical protein